MSTRQFSIKYSELGVVNSNGLLQSALSQASTGVYFPTNPTGMYSTLTVGTGLFTSGITLPTFNGTGSLLNYYEEYTFDTSWVGPFASPVNGPINFVRVGKQVTATFPFITGTSVLSSGILMTGVDVPSRFCPADDNYMTNCIVQTDAGVLANGVIQISSGGVFRISNTLNTAFLGSGVVGLAHATSLSWTVA